MRAAAGVLCAAAFLAAMFYVTLAESPVQCTVCVAFGGSSKCATVSAPDRDQAVSQAISTACTALASGVTRSMECTRTPPKSAACSE